MINRFREEVYQSFTRRADAGLDLIDALTSERHTESPVAVSESPLFRREFEPAQRRGVKIRPYMGWASCPQHATRLEELWGRAYQSMWKDFQRLTKH